MSRKGGSAEIAALKQAEAEAQQIVNAAREERKLKLRQAQQDAKREIEEYRAAREAKLRSVQPEVRAPYLITDKHVSFSVAYFMRSASPLLSGPGPRGEDPADHVRHESHDC
jgi:C4-dicarboxylate-specific signal transduction histidine kinase